MIKTALVSGACGQDASYLMELLLEKGYKVIGMYRRSSSPNFERIVHIKDKLELFEGDITDFSSCLSSIIKYRPCEIYNLAAQSHVGTSFSTAIYTTEVDYIGVLNWLEAIKQTDTNIRFYQAGTSEQYGSCYDIDKVGKYQNEQTQFNPQSPYAIAKLAAFNLVKLYRKSYGLYCCTGILFNHESPRRGEEFVTRKITKYVAKLIKDIEDNPAWQVTSYEERKKWFINDYPKLKLGNLTAYRDWGFSGDYVKAMHLMLQQKSPKDYVISTGETHSVEEFLLLAFSLYSLDYMDWIEINPALIRPSEVDYLRGDSSLARKELGWKPEITFDELVKMMLRADYEKAKK